MGQQKTKTERKRKERNRTKMIIRTRTHTNTNDQKMSDQLVQNWSARNRTTRISKQKQTTLLEEENSGEHIEYIAGLAAMKHPPKKTIFFHVPFLTGMTTFQQILALLGTFRIGTFGITTSDFGNVTALIKTKGNKLATEKTTFWRRLVFTGIMTRNGLSHVTTAG